MTQNYVPHKGRAVPSNHPRRVIVPGGFFGPENDVDEIGLEV